MKTYQHLADKTTAPAEGRDGFGSMHVDVETIGPSGVQSDGHERDPIPTEDLNSMETYPPKRFSVIPSR